MIGIIAAVTVNGVIGVENKLPFDYPEDMKHFRTTTANSTIIMGRKTFEGIGRALPKRRNIVISSRTIEVPGVETFASVDAAMEATQMMSQPIWFIGGASIYEEGMKHANLIVLTLTPDVELRTPAIKFPWINPNEFELKSINPLVPENPSCLLKLATYEKVSC